MAKQWGDIMTCPMCGEQFAQSREHVKYCSDECAKKYQDEVYYPDYRKRYYAEHGETIRAHRRAMYRAKAVAAWQSR